MFSPSQYELVDFGVNQSGNGVKVERFGKFLLQRLSPAALETGRKIKADPEEVHARFLHREKGRWKVESELPETWSIEHHQAKFELRPTPFGHVGLFPEQQSNWDWIQKVVTRDKRTEPLRVLNLFAYTGGSTLAAAAAGAHVTHIDAAKNVVNWARRNAELSQLSDHPIRWIAEDCSRFVEREIKRKKSYDAIILDPPSYGHGPKGEIWKIDRDLHPLLKKCRQLLSDSAAFILLTCHSPGFGPAELQATFSDAVFGTCSTRVDAAALSLTSSKGNRLPAGNYVRWSR